MKNKFATDQIEYIEMCKVIWKKIKEDIWRFNAEKIQMVIENSNSLQSIWRNIVTGKHQLNTNKEDNREFIIYQDSTVEKAATLYKELYKPKTNWSKRPASIEEIPVI